MNQSKQVKQVIRRTYVITDRSFKAMEKQGIPSHLWNEIRAIPNFEKTTKVEDKPPTPKPEPVKEVKDDSLKSECLSNIELSDEMLKKMWDDARDDYLAYFDWLEFRPSFWEDEIAKNEFRRSYYNKKRGWSPKDEYEVMKIDKRIKYCQIRLEKILSNQLANQMLNEEQYEESEYNDDGRSISGISLDEEDGPVLISN